MRSYSSVKRLRTKPNDPYKIVPISPRSVVRKARSEPQADFDDTGRIFRVGYYGEGDGLDCIWLVNEEGEYEQTTDHKGLFNYYDVLMVSEEKTCTARTVQKSLPFGKRTRERKTDVVSAKTADQNWGHSMANEIRQVARR